MGQLRPNASYVYENDGSHIYARELGSTQRTLVGYYPRSRCAEIQEFTEMLDHADNDPGLRAELDKTLTYWRLIKKEY